MAKNEVSFWTLKVTTAYPDYKRPYVVFQTFHFRTQEEALAKERQKKVNFCKELCEDDEEEHDNYDDEKYLSKFDEVKNYYFESKMQLFEPYASEIKQVKLKMDIMLEGAEDEKISFWFLGVTVFP